MEVNLSPSLWQILVVVGIFAVLFMGPKRIPGLGSSLGEAIRGFKKGLSGEKDDEIDVTESTQRERLKNQTEAKVSTQEATSEKKK